MIAPKTTATSTSQAGQELTIQTLSIPSDGKYKITAQFNGQSHAGDAYITNLRIKKNGSTVLSARNSNVDDGQMQIPMFANVVCNVDCKTGDTISDTFQAENHSIGEVKKDNCILMAERIG